MNGFTLFLLPPRFKNEAKVVILNAQNNYFGMDTTYDHCIILRVPQHHAIMISPISSHSGFNN